MFDINEAIPTNEKPAIQIDEVQLEEIVAGSSPYPVYGRPSFYPGFGFPGFFRPGFYYMGK